MKGTSKWLLLLLLHILFISSPGGEDTPDSVSEIQELGAARISFDDQQYEKVQQSCSMQYTLTERV